MALLSRRYALIPVISGVQQMNRTITFLWYPFYPRYTKALLFNGHFHFFSGSIFLPKERSVWYHYHQYHNDDRHKTNLYPLTSLPMSNLVFPISYKYCIGDAYSSSNHCIWPLFKKMSTSSRLNLNRINEKRQIFVKVESISCLAFGYLF